MSTYVPHDLAFSNIATTLGSHQRYHHLHTTPHEITWGAYEANGLHDLAVGPGELAEMLRVACHKAVRDQCGVPLPAPGVLGNLPEGEVMSPVQVVKTLTMVAYQACDWTGQAVEDPDPQLEKGWADSVLQRIVTALIGGFAEAALKGTAAYDQARWG